MNPLRPRNQSKAAADAEAKRAGGLYYDKSKHNIVIRSHKQPGLKRLCILTPFSVSGFCMLQHGSGTVNPDSKPPPNASFTPKGDGDFKLPLTSKAYDEECIDNFGQDLEFSKFRAWWLKMTKWFVIECLKIGAIANMGQKKKDMIAAKKTQLQVTFFLKDCSLSLSLTFFVCRKTSRSGRRWPTPRRATSCCWRHSRRLKKPRSTGRRSRM